MPGIMQKIWLVLTEIVAQTTGQPSEIGFMNVMTWADSCDSAGAKIKQYLESFGWHLVSVEKADVVEENVVYGEDVADMIDRTRNNPKAIILGTFHTYKTN